MSAQPSRRVLILMHEGTRPEDLQGWAISQLAEAWVELGIEARVAFGLDSLAEADLLFLHVDLSVVPEPYLEAARAYPAAVNGRIRDIRKSVISRQLVYPGDGWTGPCIVKTDANCAGAPERAYKSRGALPGATAPEPPAGMATQLQYAVYASREEVPEACFHSPDLVVERFLPEVEEGLYHTRSHHVLGRASTTVRLSSPHPIVLGRTASRVEEVEPHPEILAIREALGLDYGKLDYVVHHGQVVLLDVNKTTGGMRNTSDPWLLGLRRRRALGILDFLP